MTEFSIIAPTERKQFDSGMVRGTSTGKVKYLLTRDGPMFDRWAQHLTGGAEIYGDRNWMQARGPEELERFRESADRHFQQWLRGDLDEDHAAAVFFNINGAEYVRERMQMETLNFGGRDKPLIAVDWDGTLVEQVWPEEGDWLPGAVRFLRDLADEFSVVIYTTRIVGVSYDDWSRPLSANAVQKEIDYIRRMLDEEGLDDVAIFQSYPGDLPGKISADLYLDDKAVTFTDYGSNGYGYDLALREIRNRLRG